MSDTPDVMKEILVCVNTDAYQLAHKLKSKFKTEVVNDNNTLVEDEDTRYIFTSFIGLNRNLKALTWPPILCENPSVARLIGISYPTISLDADFHDNGVITFKPITGLLKLLCTPFKPQGKIIFAKSEVVQYGVNSGLAKAINDFLLTVPSFTHESFFVALAELFETSDFQVFTEYVENNRLVSNENVETFGVLEELLVALKKYFAPILNKDKRLNTIKDRKIKMNLQRIRFILNYYGSRNLSSYLDKEASINLRQKILSEKKGKK